MTKSFCCQNFCQEGFSRQKAPKANFSQQQRTSDNTSDKKRERKGKRWHYTRVPSLHFDNAQGSHFSICSDGALNFPKAMDSFPGTSSIPIKHGRKSQTRQIFLQPPFSAGSSSIPRRIVKESCSAFLLHFLLSSKH